MSSKKTKMISVIVLAILSITVIFVMHKFIGSGSKDIKSAKSFIERLHAINAIDDDEDLKNIKYKRVKTLGNKNKLIYKTITANSFGIDLDKNYNVIGFANKDIKKDKYEISYYEAKEKSKKYLENICTEELTFRGIKNEKDTDKLPYYSFVYLKCKNGYPIYSDEIIICINKSNGLLENYTNSSIQKECKDFVINISQEEAEKEALNLFDKLNDNGEVVYPTELAYAERKAKCEKNLSSELCYVVTVKGKDKNDAEFTNKFFITTESKEVINDIKYGTENSVVTD
ncbi:MULTISPECIES: hypothetical protein [Clostridium]|uniref:Peptidase propeptide and YPEB domain protein n=1 Tax=Clostridium aquiflavi TaxID=3073603 RepID=A0ABU1EF93_9CLOT|nr:MULTISPECIES: hypothetical protein [unclassified Clostridium]MDR5587032.1 hypothetical protein [Clostridium sp. 5N-1]NFG60496.1 hypothetical protein [Clostridium botulinum]NFQ09861.1 hypothetical protein [Clostridium botulinum]